MQRRQRHVVIGGDGAAISVERVRWLRYRGNARCRHERRVPAARPIEMLLPSAMLARGELGWHLGAIADEIGRSIFCDLARDLIPPLCDEIDRRAGEPRQRQRGGHNLFALCLPFGGDCRGEFLAAYDERRLGWRADRLAVEQHGIAAGSVADRGNLEEPLHRSPRAFSGARSANTSRSSPSSKPKKSQVSRICGGSGAITISVPPAGCGIASARACRCARRLPGTPATCDAAPPYLPSPKIGVPSAAQWARSWWVRPVTGSSASHAMRSPACATVR